MPRGLGSVQAGLLAVLYLDRARDPIELVDYVFGGPGTTWWSISVLDDKPRPPGTEATAQHRSDRSIARRAIYGLKRRGLVDTYVGHGAYAAQRQLNTHISDEGVEHVSTHMRLLERAHALRRRVIADPGMLLAEVIQYAKTSTLEPCHAEHFRQCALEALDREINLDNFEDVIWATDEYLDLEFKQYVQYADFDGNYLDEHADIYSYEFDEALLGLMLSEPAHPFLMSLMLYRARSRIAA